jgi:hypothetical protein
MSEPYATPLTDDAKQLRKSIAVVKEISNPFERVKLAMPVIESCAALILKLSARVDLLDAERQERG